MIPSFTVEENMNLSSIDHYSKRGCFQQQLLFLLQKI